jgi:hypothetical protein
MLGLVQLDRIVPSVCKRCKQPILACRQYEKVVWTFHYRKFIASPAAFIVAFRGPAHGASLQNTAHKKNTLNPKKSGPQQYWARCSFYPFLCYGARTWSATWVAVTHTAK